MNGQGTTVGERDAASATARAPAPFQPAWWLPGPHLQTIWPAVAEPVPALSLEPHRIELPDGDFMELFIAPPAAGPVVLLLHGMAGSARSGYVLRTAERLRAHGYQAVAMQYRGAGGRNNRLPRFYHSGAVGDVEAALKALETLFPGRPSVLVGFSLGGILTLNYCGTAGDAARCRAGIAISAPLALDPAARSINRGFARLYQWDILRCLKAMLRRKFPRDLPPEIAGIDLNRIRTLWAFDDRITAPLHGYRDAPDYYARCSPREHLRGIDRPLLFLAARDDPFLPAAAMDGLCNAPSALQVERPQRGGHVGFVAGGRPYAASHWLPRRVCAFLDSIFAE